MRESAPLLAGEVIDSSVMSKRALIAFLEEQSAKAKESSVLFSLHLKATMMKVSDPIIFGYAVSVFFKKLIQNNKDLFNQIGVNLNNGFGDLLKKIEKLPANEKKAIEADIEAAYANGPGVAMVDSDKVKLCVPFPRTSR